MGERRERPRQRQREMKIVGRVRIFSDFGDLVLKIQENPGINLKGEMQVKRAVTSFFRMQIHFPRLAQRIGLDEMTFVVYVETVVNGGVVFEICDVTSDVDDRHVCLLDEKGKPMPHSLRCGVAVHITRRG